jgi:hypothetical protein
MLDCGKYSLYGGAKLRKVAIAILIISVMLTGCTRATVNTKQAPLAYIDSVSSSQIWAGETIKFTGHGISSIGQVVAYNWRSSQNGDLSQLATFETSSLTAGTHSIWFRVQDNYGNWSQEVSTNVNVMAQGGPTKMNIKTFSGSPSAITEGEYSTLSWEVTGTGTVKIDPEVGEVSLSGSRAVRPSKDTTYTLFATNDEGVNTAKTKVVVSSVPLYTLTTYSIAAEDGTVRKDKIVLEEVLVGESEYQIQMQGFLSFDISALPATASIKSVELDMSKTNINGSPFPWQGSLLLYNQQYGSLSASDYMNIVPAGYLFSWSYNYSATMMPDKPFTSPEFVSTMQKQLEAGSKRYQVRLQFEKYYYYSRIDYTDKKYQNLTSNVNYIDVGAGTPKLTIRYQLPQ